MKIEIKHIASRKETAEGFPLVIEISHQNKRKAKTICYCKEIHWMATAKMISEKHPDFDFLAPMIMNLKLRARQLVLSGENDVEKAFQVLFAEDNDKVMFLAFAKKLIADMKAIAVQLGKANELQAQNKQIGNSRVYENVIAQFGVFGKNVALADLDYDVLTRFRNYQTGIGNSKSTVHLYLRTLRTIYNKGIAVHRLENKMPFAGVFDGLKQRSFNNKKKYLDKDLIRELEILNLQSAKQKYVDLFLLQFYFGGCDLVDLYYLRNKQIRRGRVIFERTKTNTGTRIDLKIHPKALILLKKYETPGEWVFPWDKDRESYENFRRTYQRGLIYVQQKNEIEVLPDGGYMGVKVARHTFANIAKGLMIEPDVIRELMGHERDDVDNYYKDKYPEMIRDNALFEIISWFNCVK
jgi:integrase